MNFLQKKAVHVPKKLLDEGNESEILLSEAVINNDTRKLKDLLKNKRQEIDLDKGIKGLPPLLVASMMNKLEICQILVELGGAKVNEVSSRWQTTPLKLAVKGAHPKIVSYLMEAGKILFPHQFWAIQFSMDFLVVVLPSIMRKLVKMEVETLLAP